MKNIFEEIGYNLDVEVLTDSSAARGMAHRRGPGPMKHLHVKVMFVQELIEKRLLKILKNLMVKKLRL